MHYVLPLEQKEYTTSPLVPEQQGMVYPPPKWLALNASVFTDVSFRIPYHNIKFLRTPTKETASIRLCAKKGYLETRDSPTAE